MSRKFDEIYSSVIEKDEHKTTKEYKKLSPKMKKAVDNRDWHEAALQMQDSKWYNQVPNRADRLVQEMKTVSE